MEENQNTNQKNSMDEVRNNSPVFPASSNVPVNNDFGQPIQSSSEIQIPNNDLHIELARQAAANTIKDEPLQQIEEKQEENTAIPESDIAKDIEEIMIPQITEEIKKDEIKQEDVFGTGKVAVITKILEQIAGEIEQIKKLIAASEGAEVKGELVIAPEIVPQEIVSTSAQDNVVEGVFDGESMIGSNGKKYDVPPNYASKSKLVEGDILKLTITAEGSFLFKQIGPIERNRIVGMLTYEPVSGRYVVVADGKKWFVLTASATYFRGKPGDEAVILVPKNAPSQWAAVENIIGRKSFGGYRS